jgi:hypothetical protein
MDRQPIPPTEGDAEPLPQQFKLAAKAIAASAKFLA